MKLEELFEIYRKCPNQGDSRQCLFESTCPLGKEVGFYPPQTLCSLFFLIDDVGSRLEEDVVEPEE